MRSNFKSRSANALGGNNLSKGRCLIIPVITQSFIYAFNNEPHILKTKHKWQVLPPAIMLVFWNAPITGAGLDQTFSHNESRNRPTACRWTVLVQPTTAFWTGSPEFLRLASTPLPKQLHKNFVLRLKNTSKIWVRKKGAAKRCTLLIISYEYRNVSQSQNMFIKLRLCVQLWVSFFLTLHYLATCWSIFPLNFSQSCW